MQAAALWLDRPAGFIALIGRKFRGSAPLRIELNSWDRAQFSVSKCFCKRIGSHHRLVWNIRSLFAFHRFFDKNSADFFRKKLRREKLGIYYKFESNQMRGLHGNAFKAEFELGPFWLTDRIRRGDPLKWQDELQLGTRGLLHQRLI